MERKAHMNNQSRGDQVTNTDPNNAEPTEGVDEGDRGEAKVVDSVSHDEHRDDSSVPGTCKTGSSSTSSEDGAKSLTLSAANAGRCIRDTEGMCHKLL